MNAIDSTFSQGFSPAELADDPALLKLELLSSGARLSPSLDIGSEGGRPLLRTRAGLGSGLEVVLPGGHWVNIAVTEAFAARSPLAIDIDPDGGPGDLLIAKDGEVLARARVAPRPAWYLTQTKSGRPMASIGTLQGTYLGVYVGKVCEFWAHGRGENCRFCSVGLNVGKDEAAQKTDDDILEVIHAARRESKITYVDLNAGHSDDPEAFERMIALTARIRREVKVLIGVQAPPTRDFSAYERLRAAGANRVSFCFELFDPKRFQEICPGKARVFGRAHFFEAIRYAVGLSRGASLGAPWVVNGEIIAGLEPVSQTMAGIDAVTAMGAIPTVTIFRPLAGTALADAPPPSARALLPVFGRLFDQCVHHGLPIGVAPGIQVSLVMLPEECASFSKRAVRRAFWRLQRLPMKLAAELFLR